MRKRVRCIEDKRPDLGRNIVDSFIRKEKFYTVIDEHVPAPVENAPEWITVRCEETRQDFTRPRYMFGRTLTDNTTYSDANS